MTGDPTERLRSEVEELMKTVSTLTPFQRRFVARLLSQIGPSNATKAYLDAGGTAKHPDRAAYQLRHNPKIIAAIDEYFHSQEASAAEAVAILSNQMRASMEDFFDFPEDESLDPEIDLHKARRHRKLNQLKKFRKKRTTYTDKDGGETVTEWMDVELYDAQAAAVQIARIQGKYGPSGSEDDPLNVNTAVTYITENRPAPNGAEASDD